MDLILPLLPTWFKCVAFSVGKKSVGGKSKNETRHKELPKWQLSPRVRFRVVESQPGSPSITAFLTPRSVPDSSAPNSSRLSD